ncbi:TIGR02300 family protein [Tianweitania sp. BSSL-BM11]|uniref:TIGR02300 family protein n=1 Tax=Tianweitania aestuarii TaxID=2814886 RepID=A0ABS5RS84_9HYPH|nr:TIGR02300 family protein [Tianweitania aestuarii]
MANPELGTKRVCPETGRKFYDLNKDPIVSPYTGKTYPLSFFETTASPVRASTRNEDADEKETNEVEEVDDEAETISLEEADEDNKEDENLPDIDEDDDVDLGDDDENTFLEDEEDEDDDLEDIVRGGDEDDES